jgi:hypothetical protein
MDIPDWKAVIERKIVWIVPPSYIEFMKAIAVWKVKILPILFATLQVYIFFEMFRGSSLV